MRVIVGALLVFAVLTLAATSAAAHQRSCGAFSVQGTTFAVTVLRGPVRCHVARHVLRRFMTGKGKMHGPPGGPVLSQWWSVDGWKCGHGAGGGACIRGGKTYKTARNWIEAQVE